MRTFPISLILQKNLLSQTDPWLILLDIVVPDGTILRLVRNTEDITFRGNIYTAFPFEVDAVQQQSQGQIPSVSLKVNNITREIQAYVEDFEGFIGSTVTMYVVNAKYLLEDYTDLTFEFEILGCGADSNLVTFTLGAPNPLIRRFPLHRYLSNHCRFVGRFKGARCGYTGEDTDCQGTLVACQVKGNGARFGGFPGIGAGGMRIV